MVQFSHLYMTIGKTIALIIQIFVDKVMFLLFSIMRSINNSLTLSKRIKLGHCMTKIEINSGNFSDRKPEFLYPTHVTSWKH